MVNNPSNPTSEDILKWAFDPHAPWPHQEWDLFLVWKRDENLYLQLASDQKCPKRSFFIHILYSIVGSLVYEAKEGSHEIVKGFIAKANSSLDPAIQKWVKRSTDLLKNPTQYSYEDWRGGKLAGFNEW